MFPSAAFFGLSALLLACGGCGDDELSDPGAPEGSALAPPPAALSDPPDAISANLQLPSPGDDDPEGPDEPALSADEKIGLEWGFTPKQLMVYRSTAVHFRLEQAPKGHETASCSWNFGDGSPIEQGCTVSHTFHGGQADQVVTLTLQDGDWTWTSTKTVPLEKLPVGVAVGGDFRPASSDIPEAGKPGDTTFRFALIADSAASGGVPKGVDAAIEALTRKVRPELVIHVGGIVAEGGGDQAWDGARDKIATPLADAEVEMAWATSPTDREEGARVRRTEVSMIDGRYYPERYSFTYKGSFFLVFSSDDTEGVTEETIRWMRDELAKARVYNARYVVSYLPLHKFADAHLGSLDKKFRLYELFLRARVTTLFSAGYRVFFKGRYGALPVVSVGALVGEGGKLAGSDFKQPTSFAVVDSRGGAPERVFAVEGPHFDRVFEEALLPDTVEVYTR